MESTSTSVDWPHCVQYRPAMAVPQLRQHGDSCACGASSWRGLGCLDGSPEEPRAGQHGLHVARQPGVVVGDDVRVELALDFVDEAVVHAAAPRGDSGS
jgi:hypothetical protein